ncbi:MAG: right-handed parallel beta-helix repeat-containing protein [Acidobacteria bacterium]|nr:right-handed parallel beta-helix repeat-containing protein [Acidobacteriota bacterium]
MALLVSSPVLGILGFDYYSGRLGVIWPKNDVVDQKGGRVIKVPPGGNLQGAIDSAQSGDVVELQAGAVYSGQINLSNKPLTDYVTIRSSGIDDLPANKRVTPGQRGSMATIQSGMMGRAAVMAANGAHHYRFIGIEFTPSSSMYNYGLVQLGHGEFKPANVPHDIEIDRSYIHPFRSGVTRRGIALNSANTTIKNSYIEGIAFPGEETQGICGWSGTRNVKILNNYIEAGAENIMFGGSDPDNADLIPSDIEVRGNTLNKPAEWKGKATVKALFEIKNAKRLMFAGNLLTNNWEGSAFRVTVRDQDGGAPFSTIEDVTIRDNVIKGAGEGINILGRDDTYPSQTLQRLVIANNLFLDIGGKEFEGSGYFIQIAAGNDITIANNTVFNLGNITTFYGDMPTGFVFRNNVTSHGNYGVHGLDVRSEQARAMYLNNVFMNLAHVGDGDTAYPQGNAFVRNANDVGFVNISDGDYRIDPRSKYSAKGCDLSRFTPDLLSAIH